MRKFLNVFTVLVLILVIGFFVSCEENEEGEEGEIVQPETTKDLSFLGTDTDLGTDTAGYSVIISSDEKFTITEWDTLCNKVVEAIIRASEKGDTEKRGLSYIFYAPNKSKIILLKSGFKNAEKNGVNENGAEGVIIYLNINTIDTVDILEEHIKPLYGW